MKVINVVLVEIGWKFKMLVEVHMYVVIKSRILLLFIAIFILFFG